MGEGRAAGAARFGAGWKMARVGDIGWFGDGSGFPQRYQVSAYASTAALPALNGTALSGIQILLPPLPEQRAIATVLSDMDSEIAALERRLDKTRAIKQGMMQQFLTGAIRLPIPSVDGKADP